MSQPESEILGAALAYAARGWRVFPCDPNPQKPFAKRPLVAADKDANGKPIGGTGWPQKASADPEVIRGWWRRWPKALIGMAPGWAGGFVVDLDPKGEAVEAVEARLVAALGADLPATARTVTQSGGRHLWFARPDGGLGNATPGLANIDIRCDAGYVILPPSVMGNGAAYAWEGAPFDPATAPPVPDRLIAMIREKTRAGVPEGASGDGVRRTSGGGPAAVLSGAMGAGDEAVRRYARGALDRIVAEASSTGKGGRGSAVFAAACALGRFVAAGALSEREALAAAEDAAEACGLVREDGAARVGREIARGIATGRADAGDVVAALKTVRAEAEAKVRRRGGGGAGGARGALHAPEPPPHDSIPDRAGPDGDRFDDPDLVDEDPDDPDLGDCDPRLGDGPATPGEGAPPAGDDLAEKIRACAGLDHSDTDNAKRLIIHFGENLRVMALEGARNADYLVWCGTHWDAKGGPDAAVRQAQQIGDLIMREADFLTATPLEVEALKAGEAATAELASLPADPEEWTDAIKARATALNTAIALAKGARAALDRRKVARRKFGISSKNKARVEAILSMAAPHITVPTERWNADPYTFATRGHTHRFVVATDENGRRHRRIVTAKGHRRDDYITRIIDVDFDREAVATKLEAFMAAMLPDLKTRVYVQTFNGLSLTGIPIQKLLFHYGFGSNGKSIFLEVMHRVFGDLAVTLAAETVSGAAERSAQGATPDLARLYGKWAVRIPELPKGQPLRESLVKTLTGGEQIQARQLFKGAFQFVPSAKPQGSGNGYPTLDGSDYGMMRRIAVIFWPVTVPEAERRDFNELVDELSAERAGILNWLIDGALTYFDEGLIAPDGVLAATDDLRQEMDPVGAFKDACIRAKPGWSVTASELFDAYTAWALASAMRPMSQTKFGSIMKTKLTRTDGAIRRYPDVELHSVPRNPAMSRDD